MKRVLVAEDSAVTREYLVFLLDNDPELQVVGTARNGLEAVEQVERLKPDIIVMDVHMPHMNGYEATRQIMERVPTPIVMVSASFNQDEVAMTFEALKAGALTVVGKPLGLDHPAQAETVQQLVATVKLMAEVKVVRRWPRGRGQRARAMEQKLGAREPGLVPGACKIRLIAIGASTGGPQVLVELLARLPGDLSVPLLVVQHITPGFIPGLVMWLNDKTSLTVKLAESGEVVRPRTVYLAPDGWQMGITPAGRMRLAQEAAEDGFCPSASYLFRSVAEAYGHFAMGILLTGMGRDGVQGLLRLRQAGGVTVAQDEASSVIFGMPGEAIRLGAAEYVLPPAQIAAVICSLATLGAGSIHSSF
jgi:two-component system chemotaxis response regulator CheB